MPSLPSLSTTSTVLSTTVAAVCVSVATTYVLTSRYHRQQRQKERIEAYHARQDIVKKVALRQKEQNEPTGTKINDVEISQVYLWEVEHLSNRFESEAGGKVNRMKCLSESAQEYLRHRSKLEKEDDTTSIPQDMHEHAASYNKLIASHECILADLVRKPTQPSVSRAYIRAGPREYLHFDPQHVSAAIVTCGGLCPGLNNVVREITKTLYNLYGIGGKVYGIRGGYRGFYDDDLLPLILTCDSVENIHHMGGTILASSRGGFDLDKIIGFLSKHKVKHLYVIGGDGTHRGAFRIHEGCIERGLNVSVAGIPKTIDNDVDYIDHSFGFSSAVEAAQASIHSAKTEAKCNLPNGVGIVKLMGRSAGFIAVHAVMSSGDVDLCLIPEVPTVLKGPLGCLPHIRRRVKQQGWAVIVVAEGAGEEILGTSAETDASGNKKLPKIGEFMKSQVEEYFKEHGETATVKYIDPSYMIRSIPANAADSLYCMQLAQNAVHGAMAGYTGFSVGLCNNRMTFLPIPELVATSPRSMNPRGRTWERVLAVTRQPNTAPLLKHNDDPYESHAPMLR